LDAGITTGIAVLDTDGNLLTVYSRRSMRRGEIVKIITKFGQPIIISSDVNPAPKSIEKIAAILGSKLHYPEVSLSMREKEKLIKWYEFRPKNKHEIDALSACLKAWKNYRPLFLKIRNRLEKFGFSAFFDEVIARLVKEESKNVESAMNNILSKKR
jgi:predicted RNase H-like nuclease (RuvC/YqgF family)